jgi:hypothetical protein
VVAKLTSSDGERIAAFAAPVFVDHIDPLGPLYMNVPNIGGGALNQWTPGVVGGVGLNNVGLLVRTCGGVVSYRDPQGRFFYLDNGDNLYDGSHYGIRVICDDQYGGGKLAMPLFGKYVIVTGISSTAIVSGHTVRAIRPRRQTDIQALN